MLTKKNAHSWAQKSPRRERVKLFSYNLLIIWQLNLVGGGSNYACTSASSRNAHRARQYQRRHCLRYDIFLMAQHLFEFHGVITS